MRRSKRAINIPRRHDTWIAAVAKSRPRKAVRKPVTLLDVTGALNPVCSRSHCFICCAGAEEAKTFKDRAPPMGRKACRNCAWDNIRFAGRKHQHHHGNNSHSPKSQSNPTCRTNDNSTRGSSHLQFSRSEESRRALQKLQDARRRRPIGFSSDPWDC